MHVLNVSPLSSIHQHIYQFSFFFQKLSEWNILPIGDINDLTFEQFKGSLSNLLL